MRRCPKPEDLVRDEEKLRRRPGRHDRHPPGTHGVTPSSAYVRRKAVLKTSGEKRASKVRRPRWAISAAQRVIGEKAFDGHRKGRRVARGDQEGGVPIGHVLGNAVDARGNDRDAGLQRFQEGQ